MYRWIGVRVFQGWQAQWSFSGTERVAGNPRQVRSNAAAARTRSDAMLWVPWVQSAQRTSNAQGCVFSEESMGHGWFGGVPSLDGSS